MLSITAEKEQDGLSFIEEMQSTIDMLTGQSNLGNHQLSFPIQMTLGCEMLTIIIS